MNLEYPFFWVNFKAYPGTAGAEGLEIARTIERVAEETGVAFVVSPQLPDLRLLAAETDLALMAQYADAIEPGRGMGRIPLETVAAAGADALSINHAERRDTLDDVVFKVERCSEVGLDSVVSAHGVEQGRALASFDPDCLVFEVPEDIATGRAVTQSHPELVEEFVATVEAENPRTRVFVGGGIGEPDDVRLAFEQGADAVGAASAVVGAEDRYELLSDLAAAFP